MAKKGKGIFLVYVDIDAKHDKEFNDWYNTEHLPELLADSGGTPFDSELLLRSRGQHRF